MGLKGPCCAAASLGHLRRIMWLNRPVNSGHRQREESFSPLHNAPNEVAGGSVIPGWALCSLFTICLMTERGLPSAPVLPNEPQREITGSIVARHRSLALIRPNKPVSSQGRTHPSTASQEPHTAHSFSRSLCHYDIRVTWPYHPLKYNLHSCSPLFIFTCWHWNNRPFSLLATVCCSADNVWVCICIDWVSPCPPFRLHFKRGYSSWPALPPGAPAKRMQMSMSTMVPTAARSRPKTEDKAADPFIRNPWSPLNDTSCSHQHWSPPKNHVASQPRYPICTAFLSTHRWAFGLALRSAGLESAQTSCIVIHIPPPCRRLLNICFTKVKREMRGKVNNLCLFFPLFPLSLFQQAFLCGHYLG